jgi:hypothetical protein
MLGIVAELMVDVKRNKQATGQANGQSEYIDKRKDPVLYQTSKGEFYIRFEHKAVLYGQYDPIQMIAFLP